MARINGLKSKVLLVLCSFFLLTTEVLSEVSENPRNSTTVVAKQVPTDENHFNLTLPTKQLLSINESLVVPVPRIIAELGRLMGASMGQLDSALSWPDGLPKLEHGRENVTFSPSPLIEYSQSFRTTILQIINRLSNTLRMININSDRMALQSAVSGPSYINTLQRHLTRSQKSSLFVDLISTPLKKLMDLSENNVMLSNQTSSELEMIVNLTNALSDVVNVTYSYKLEHRKNITDEITKAKNVRNKLKEERNSLNKTHEEWKNNAKELEQEFYTTLKKSQIEFGQGLGAKDKKKTSCTENRLKNWANINDTLKIKDCNEKLSNIQKSAILEVRGVKGKWQPSMRNMSETFNIFAVKREEHHNQSIAIKELERKEKQFGMDIDLLAHSTNSINRLLEEMKELLSGWKNLASLCSSIGPHISEVVTLLPSNSSTSGTRKPINEELVNLKLEKIRQDMDSVGKMAKFYVNVYDADLSSLSAQLDRMVTISDVDPNTLKEDLVNDCQKVENKLMGKPTDSTEEFITTPDSLL